MNGLIEIKKNQIIKTINTLPKEYELSFEVKFTSYTNVDWSNIIHLTVGGNMATYGDRTPGVWIFSGSNFHFSSAINGVVDGIYGSNVTLKLMEWTKVKISQLLMNGNYVFTIWVAESIVYNVINYDAREFNDVKVYISDPWFVAQAGYVRNLIIKNAYVGKNYFCTLIT